jgi:hypothetical protein
MVVVPQAAPKTLAVPSALADSSAVARQSTNGQALHETAGVGGNGLSLRDLALGVPASQRPAIEPISAQAPIDENGNLPGAFNPGWTLPATTIEGRHGAPSVSVTAPRSVVYSQAPNGRYGQPAWANARVNSSASVVQQVAQPAPSVVSPPAAR